jgi:predicted MFS family arabinose efflux permease
MSAATKSIKSLIRKALSSELVTVYTIISVCYMSVFLLEPILPIYLSSIGASPSVTGLMFAVIVLGMVFGETWGGWIADRLGPKIPLYFGTFICSGAVLLLIFIKNIPGIFIIFIFWGLLRSTIWGPGRGYVAKAAPFDKKAVFMAILSTLMAISGGLASLASGFIVDNCGYDRNFLFSTIILVIAGLIIVIGLRKIPFKLKTRAASEIETDKTAVEKPEINHRLFVPQCVVVALRWMGIGIMSAFLPLFSYKVIGLTATQVGINATIGAVVTAALLIPFGRLADSKDKRMIMGVGLLIIALSFVGVAFSRSYAPLVFFIITSSIGSAMFIPSSLAFLSLSVPSQRQNYAMGVYGAAEDIGFIIGSSAGGLFWNLWGPSSTFLAGTVAGMIGMIFCFHFIKGSRSQKTAA